MIFTQKPRVKIQLSHLWFIVGKDFYFDSYLEFCFTYIINYRFVYAIPIVFLERYRRNHYIEIDKPRYKTYFHSKNNCG